MQENWRKVNNELRKWIKIRKKNIQENKYCKKINNDIDTLVNKTEKKET